MSRSQSMPASALSLPMQGLHDSRTGEPACLERASTRCRTRSMHSRSSGSSPPSPVNGSDPSSPALSVAARLSAGSPYPRAPSPRSPSGFPRETGSTATTPSTAARTLSIPSPSPPPPPPPPRNRHAKSRERRLEGSTARGSDAKATITSSRSSIKRGAAKAAEGGYTSPAAAAAAATARAAPAAMGPPPFCASGGTGGGRKSIRTLDPTAAATAAPTRPAARRHAASLTAVGSPAAPPARAAVAPSLVRRRSDRRRSSAANAVAVRAEDLCGSLTAPDVRRVSASVTRQQVFAPPSSCSNTSRHSYAPSADCNHNGYGSSSMNLHPNSSSPTVSLSYLSSMETEALDARPTGITRASAPATRTPAWGPTDLVSESTSVRATPPTAYLSPAVRLVEKRMLAVRPRWDVGPEREVSPAGEEASTGPPTPTTAATPPPPPSLPAALSDAPVPGTSSPPCRSPCTSASGQKQSGDGCTSTAASSSSPAPRQGSTPHACDNTTAAPVITTTSTTATNLRECSSEAVPRALRLSTRTERSEARTMDTAEEVLVAAAAGGGVESAGGGAMPIAESPASTYSARSRASSSPAPPPIPPLELHRTLARQGAAGAWSAAQEPTTTATSSPARTASALGNTPRAAATPSADASPTDEVEGPRAHAGDEDERDSESAFADLLQETVRLGGMSDTTGRSPITPKLRMQLQTEQRRERERRRTRKDPRLRTLRPSPDLRRRSSGTSRAGSHRSVSSSPPSTARHGGSLVVEPSAATSRSPSERGEGRGGTPRSVRSLTPLPSSRRAAPGLERTADGSDVWITTEETTSLSPSARHVDAMTGVFVVEPSVPAPAPDSTPAPPAAPRPSADAETSGQARRWSTSAPRAGEQGGESGRGEEGPHRCETPLASSTTPPSHTAARAAKRPSRRLSFAAPTGASLARARASRASLAGPASVAAATGTEPGGRGGEDVAPMALQRASHTVAGAPPLPVSAKGQHRPSLGGGAVGSLGLSGPAAATAGAAPLRRLSTATAAVGEASSPHASCASPPTPGRPGVEGDAQASSSGTRWEPRAAGLPRPVLIPLLATPKEKARTATIVFDLDETLCNNHVMGPALLRPGAVHVLQHLRSLFPRPLYKPAPRLTAAEAMSARLYADAFKHAVARGTMAASTGSTPVDAESATGSVRLQVPEPALPYDGLRLEIVLWTASMEQYARPVVARLDPNGEIFDQLIFRDVRWYTNIDYTKELVRLGRAMDRCVIVENAPASVYMNRRNALLVSDFIHNRQDRQLFVVKAVLSEWLQRVHQLLLRGVGTTAEESGRSTTGTESAPGGVGDGKRESPPQAEAEGETGAESDGEGEGTCALTEAATPTAEASPAPGKTTRERRVSASLPGKVGRAAHGVRARPTSSSSSSSTRPYPTRFTRLASGGVGGGANAPPSPTAGVGVLEESITTFLSSHPFIVPGTNFVKLSAAAMLARKSDARSPGSEDEEATTGGAGPAALRYSANRSMRLRMNHVPPSPAAQEPDARAPLSRTGTEAARSLCRTPSTRTPPSTAGVSRELATGSPPVPPRRPWSTR